MTPGFPDLTHHGFHGVSISFLDRGQSREGRSAILQAGVPDTSPGDLRGTWPWLANAEASLTWAQAGRPRPCAQPACAGKGGLGAGRGQTRP